MRLLLDTHFVLALVDHPPHAAPSFLRSPQSIHASTVSLWEIAIKHRLGKLPMYVALDTLPEALALLGIDLLVINPGHVLAEFEEKPNIRDPFDRLLLAQCQVENLRLVTEDRALVSHPLAWREN